MASISAAAASPPIVLKELDELFSWNPPRLVPRPVDDREPSTTTRQPAFFDRHFSTKLALKRVVRLPSLVEDLAKTVDSALDAAKHTLPELSRHFYTTKDRRRAVEQAERHVRDEKGVCVFYSHTTAIYCPIVASTLAFHPTAPSWLPLIYWTDAVSSSRHAIMDAELTFYAADDTEVGERREEIIKTMESGHRRILETMRETQSPLMMFEFKSLSAGPEEVMTVVPKLGDFNWPYCGSPRNPYRILEHKKIRDMAEAIIPGPDALNPPWNIRVCSYITSSTMLNVMFIGFRVLQGNSSNPTN